ncbi:MAG: hypothetical protein FD120_1249 [Gammaproteobacteria bacterium]|nr:MAG: hypothetical protein FD120_1249 [Gammaproteobacteria bacterium]
MLSLAAAGMSLVFSGAAAADTLRQAVAEGKASGDIRYRYEYVDQDGLAEQAGASTIRTLLGYATGPFYGAGAFVEFEDVSVLGAERYNSTLNGKATYPVVADPEGTEVNQAFLEYSAIADTRLRAGRQRIIYDNARFIGNVGWRQNEQTYDGVAIVNKSLADTTLNYAYLTNVNTITGVNLESDALHLLNASYGGVKVGTLTAYAYLFDFETATDSQTLGVRFSGAADMSEGVKAVYAAEYASQSDYADAPSTVDADYMLVEAGVGMKATTFKLGYELLSGDGVYSFQTPLATKHAFNGWADKFLTTPANGLEDLYFSVESTVKGVKLAAIYHDFSADQGGSDYGSEIDLLAATKLAKDYSVGIKYAGYSADGFATDTDKLWLWAGTSF